MATINSYSVSTPLDCPLSLTQDLAVRFFRSLWNSYGGGGGGASQTWTGCIVELAFASSGVSLHDSVYRHVFGMEEGHEMGCLIYLYQVSLREPGASPGPSAVLGSDQNYSTLQAPEI